MAKYNAPRHVNTGDESQVAADMVSRLGISPDRAHRLAKRVSRKHRRFLNTVSRIYGWTFFGIDWAQMEQMAETPTNAQTLPKSDETSVPLTQ